MFQRSPCLPTPYRCNRSTGTHTHSSPTSLQRAECSERLRVHPHFRSCPLSASSSFDMKTYSSSFSTDRQVGGGAWSPTAEDAMAFVQMVKEAFKERQPDKYHLFLRVMEDFRNQRVAIDEVTSTAAALFRDTPDLALGFNVFLPKSHRIHVGLNELAAYFIRDMNLDDDHDHV